MTVVSTCFVRTEVQYYNFKMFLKIGQKLLMTANRWILLILTLLKLLILHAPHKRLLAKVHSFGITSNILSWIKSFLNGREQRVVVNGQKSNCDIRSSSGFHSSPDSVYCIHK